jgi:hypothetical protein
MKKLLSKFYILGLIALTVLFMAIIWNLTFAELFEEYHIRKRVLEAASINIPAKNLTEQISFKKAILESDERVKHYLGYRVLEEKRLKGHFHHIDFDFTADKTSFCIGCHGDIPHDKIKEFRAFGNMHASFLSCQTCHVRLEGNAKTGIFTWYDRTTGEIVPNPDMEGILPGTYRSKIIPFERVNGKIRRIDTQERINFAREYREMENRLTDTQKSKAKKIIHKIVSKTPYSCEDCHQKQTSVLPFKDLGYPPQRMESIVNTEIVGMIKNYTQFYMPRMLQPGFGNEKQEKGKSSDS